ncbi:hypothetical protein BCR39DRAFT_463645 [Naematelia encephala]|uniref:Uncharacterized protein n=1 Tax=Naematelia encephala TaxID=71784 RepID=A0A1Y2BGY9_9TREE|nr:hypothetical protein BCR39DRAFT_463645 [Naematelia encephala]
MACLRSGTSSFGWQLLPRCYYSVGQNDDPELMPVAVTNPSEASFRSHLTELSFRRHLADIREDNEDESSAVPTPDKSHGTDVPPIAPFRFANHVALSLRTPAISYRSLCFLSLAFTSPIGPPIFLADPLTLLKAGQKPHVPKDRVVVFVGFMGHWTLFGMLPKKTEWIWRMLTEGGRDKGRRKGPMDRAGILDMRVVTVKEETADLATPAKPAALGQSLTKLLRKSESTSNMPDLPESRRPSIAPPSDVDPNSPLIVSLKADLASAQAIVTDLKAQVSFHEESVSDAHANLQSTLEDLRTRRKEDDAERQELKSRTKSLEEQKRQAEAGRREAEKKLRAVEAVRDGLEAKIQAAVSEMDDLKAGMAASERAVRIVQEDGARHVVETREAVDGKRSEFGQLEAALDDLDRKTEELGQQVKEAEDKLKAVQEGNKMAPEEEMMMMAAAYEAAAQEGYYHQTSHQWANQAAAYMAEAGMPYLDQTYTARPAQSSGFGHLAKSREEKRVADVSGFEDFGPRAHTPVNDAESDFYGDPGSPNGTAGSFSANLLPQELFRSLEGDATPLHDDEPLPTQQADTRPTDDSDSESADDHSGSNDDVWRSPMTSAPTLDVATKHLGGTRLTPPNLTTTPPALPGLPNLPGSRRWFSGTTSAENISSYSFLHPTTSNDSLSYEASPFAPTSSEKKQLALKWGPLSKYKWAREEQQASRSSSMDLSLGGSGWLGGKPWANGNDHGGDPDEMEGEEDKNERKPFRFFSLRKPPQGSSKE